MNTPFRSMRSQTPITQSDLSFLLERGNNGGISAVEQGKVTPTLKMLLLYHLLFDVPIETLIQGYREHMKLFLKERLPMCIEAVQKSAQTPLRSYRVAHLEKALTRLSDEANV